MGKLYHNTDNKWYNSDNRGYFYPNIGIPANFTVEDYEVFQVTKL